MRLSVAILVFVLSITGISYAYWNQRLDMKVNVPVVYTMDNIVVKEEEETESQATEVIEQESINKESSSEISSSEISSSETSSIETSSIEVETTKE